jgi:hypothetical protein
MDLWGYAGVMASKCLGYGLASVVLTDSTFFSLVLKYPIGMHLSIVTSTTTPPVDTKTCSELRHKLGTV